MRRNALLGWSLPLMRAALAFTWIATGLISLFVYPRELSLELLARVGLAGGLANAALWTAALLDIALGVALLLMRSRALLYVAQLVLVATYTLVITIWLPEQWSHPFGPVLKNLPLLAMIAALAALDRGDGPDPR
ncbi:DoxX-like protein [Luteimonas sp. J16]|uniref:DoxX-like family protein n=2 Tax=unclassified Luteimonas TaxID=2629088 RepID=UPI0011ABCC74|nr:DoxX-like family protein [Luteimonas sp. J16]TWG93443.1 DoxX-like protein [Luteimonas sp. J16]